ncbi:aminoglycoside phosphotransferase family protein [Streptomyces sp. NPDC005438]|uniref:aminoglycoside phosphotransferase family protein n=1 Tax=Streptomyces sp. NPDC005438 TaxID=3156880 RepID=UPI00339DEE95
MPFVQPGELPQRLVRALLDSPDGAEAHRWLRSLPAVVDELLDAWDLSPERLVVPGGRRSLVVLTRQPGGAPTALKLLPPSPPDEESPDAWTARSVEAESAALECWGGLGAVRLVRTDIRRGALLLERARSEVSLRSLPEAKALLEAASVVRRLWVPPPGDTRFRSVAAQTAPSVTRWPLTAPPEALPLVDEALRLREELLASAPEPRLLHGDFRQAAVLASPSDRAPWLAVGPEPLIGEPAYDIARLVRDRLHDLVASPGAASMTRRRIRTLADSLELDRERVRAWSLYRAVESALRQLPVGGGGEAQLLWEFAGWL